MSTSPFAYGVIMKVQAVKPFNVWIQPLSDKRKHCRNCEEIIDDINVHIGVGEYIRGKYHKAYQCCGVCLLEWLANNVLTKRPYEIQVRCGYSRPYIVGE